MPYQHETGHKRMSVFMLFRLFTDVPYIPEYRSISACCRIPAYIKSCLPFLSIRTRAQH